MRVIGVLQVLVIFVAPTIAYRSNQGNLGDQSRTGSWPGTQRPVAPAPPRVFTLGIMLYDNVEVLDYSGPYDVFSHSGSMHGRFKVLTIAHKKTLRAMYGLSVTVDHVIGERNIPKLDIVVVPGSDGNGTEAGLNHRAFVPWLKQVSKEAQYVISVCTGVNFMCRAGIADGLDLTTHHQAFDLAERECPRSRLLRGRRFTDNGEIFSSAGISAGIDVSLYFVKKVIGRKEANEVAERMEYDWKDYDYDKTQGTIARG